MVNKLLLGNNQALYERELINLQNNQRYDKRHFFANSWYCILSSCLFTQKFTGFPDKPKSNLQRDKYWNINHIYENKKFRIHLLLVWFYRNKGYRVILGVFFRCVWIFPRTQDKLPILKTKNWSLSFFCTTELLSELYDFVASSFYG